MRSNVQALSRFAIFGVVLGSGISPTFAQSREYPHAVVKASLKVVPADISPMLLENLDPLLEASVEPEEWWPRNVETRNREDWYYIHADLAAAGTGPDARREAAQQFPREQNEAKRFCLERGHAKAGQLPWIVVEQYENLIEAFRTGSEADIVRQSGVVIYFATRISQPHAVSRDGTGQFQSNLLLADATLGTPMFAHRSAVARLFGELPQCNVGRPADFCCHRHRLPQN
jgi:hypothetical protein